MFQQLEKLFWWHLKGWLDWKRLGRLGQLHCFSFACLRKRAGCTGRVSHQVTYVESNLQGADLTWHSMTRGRRLWASGTRWACPLTATCTLSSAADPLSSSTVASACWSIGRIKGSWCAYAVHVCKWTGDDWSCCLWTGRPWTRCAECLFLLLLRQPWATSPQRLFLGKFHATPNQAELNMSGGACLRVEDMNQAMVFDRLLASSLATCPLLTSCSFLTFRTVLLPFPRHALLRYRSLQVTASGRTFEIKTLFKDSWKSFWSGIDSALSRFHWLAGFRSSATALTARFQQDMMQISTSALLATWDGTHLSFPEMTLRPRPGDWMPSWRMDAWLWWPSLACFSRHGGSATLQVNYGDDFLDWCFRKSSDEKLQSQSPETCGSCQSMAYQLNSTLFSTTTSYHISYYFSIIAE